MVLCLTSIYFNTGEFVVKGCKRQRVVQNIHVIFATFTDINMIIYGACKTCLVSFVLDILLYCIVNEIVLLSVNRSELREI